MLGKGTYFYHIDGHKLGDDNEVIPVTLYKGMVITIHGHDEAFEVVEWSYHHGHGDEEAGLQIRLAPTDKKPINRITRFGID